MNSPFKGLVREDTIFPKVPRSEVSTNAYGNAIPMADEVEIKVYLQRGSSNREKAAGIDRIVESFQGICIEPMQFPPGVSSGECRAIVAGIEGRAELTIPTQSAFAVEVDIVGMEFELTFYRQP